MEPGHPDYDRIAAEIPEVAPGKGKCIAHFLLVAELDAVATAATGKEAPQIIEAPSPTNNFQLKSAPVSAVGYDVYRDRPYVRLTIPRSGDMPIQESVCVPVNEQHTREYPREWADFQARMANTKHDIRLCHGITPAAVETLRGIGIRSMEDLAASVVELPEFIEAHRKFAKRYLAVVNGVKPRYRVVNGQIEEVA